MLQSIVNFIQAIVGVIQATFNGLANILSFIFGGTTIIFTVLGWFPSVIITFATISIVVLIIKFVIGRDNS